MVKGTVRFFLATSAFALATAVHSSETQVFTYDAAGRLTGVTVSGTANNGVSTTIGHDAAGNRTSYAVTGGTATPPPTPPPPPPPGNHPPVPGPDYISVTCNSGGGFWLFTNDSDPDGDPLTLTSVQSNGTFSVSIGNAAQGIVSLGGGYKPGNYTGSYVVSDGKGGSATGALYVTVYSGGPGGC